LALGSWHSALGSSLSLFGLAFCLLQFAITTYLINRSNWFVSGHVFRRAATGSTLILGFSP
jgi:hypothetical protein